MPLNLWCWSRLLRVHWTSRRSNQSILKEINPDYSLEGLKLKLQYFGHLMWRANSLEKILMLGKTEGRRRKGQQRTRWLDGITKSTDMSLSKLREIVKDRESLVCCSPLGCKELDTTERLNNNNMYKNTLEYNTHINVKRSHLWVAGLWVIFIFLYLYFLIP